MCKANGLVSQSACKTKKAHCGFDTHFMYLFTLWPPQFADHNITEVIYFHYFNLYWIYGTWYETMEHIYLRQHFERPLLMTKFRLFGMDDIMCSGSKNWQWHLLMVTWHVSRTLRSGTIVASAVPFLAPVPSCPSLLLPPLWVSNHDK